VVAELSNGTVFAEDYRILGVLGSGGMGVVYEAEQISTRKHRALKLLESRLGRDDKVRHRFVREATVGADIHSEHVVEVIAAGIDRSTSTPWLAMEMLDGADLARVVGHHGRLSASHALTVFSQLCHGLAAAHAAGVIHRDLKPENVFVARSHRAGSKVTIKILDFGIAKLTHELTVSTDTGTVGSPLWMAPEQLNALPLTARADVWALGLLGFWALTGLSYWKTVHQPRVTVQALFAEQLFADLDPASVRAQKLGVGDRLPRGFDAWFAACVHRDPTERFADAAAAMVALRSVLEPAAEQVSDTTPLLPPVGQTLPPPRTLPAPLVSRPRVHGLDGTTGPMMPAGYDETMAATTGSGTSPAAQAPATQPEVAAAPPGVRASRSEATVGFGRGHVAIAVAVPAMLVGAVVAWVMSTTTDVRGPADLRADYVDKRTTKSPLHSDVEAPADDPSQEGSRNEIDEVPTDESTPTDGLRDSPTTSDGVAYEFMGWTADGNLFALQVTHRDPDGRALEVVEIHDGITGARIEGYVLEPTTARTMTWPGALQTIIDDSGDHNAWIRRRMDLLLRNADARRTPGAQREILIAHEPVPAETRVRFTPKSWGYEFRWYNFVRTFDGDATLELTIDYVAGKRRDRLSTFPVPIPYSRVLGAAHEAGELPTVSGRIELHWSADSDRCVLLMSSQIERGRVSVEAQQWVLRAAGPQIEIVDAGVGATASRDAALALASASLPTTRFAQPREPNPGPEVTHAPGEEELAQQIVWALGRSLPLREDPTLSPLAARVVLTP
jgi:serine/threonine protein kinase